MSQELRDENRRVTFDEERLAFCLAEESAKNRADDEEPPEEKEKESMVIDEDDNSVRPLSQRASVTASLGAMRMSKRSSAIDRGEDLVEEKSPSIWGIYSVVAFFMLFCFVYCIVTAFTPTPTGLLSEECNCRGIDQCICARETIEAETAFQLFCLANSRAAAYTLYPLYLVMYLSMARNLRTVLQHTIIAEFIPFMSVHALHVWAGTIIGIVILWHALWHVIRWGIQGRLSLIVEHQTGITGLIVLLITPVLVWPMRLAKLRNMISFEIRKRLHYLSWVWAGVLCFHSPKSDIFWVIGSAFVLYLLDWIYGLFLTTYLVPSARFVLLESAVMIRLEKPKGFSIAEGADGYCYLCIPWISAYEWHAFSAYKDPFDPDYVCFCIAINGDWTKKLHDRIHRPIFRRLWLYGPFVSPFETASHQDNTISVASGIGITAAVSVINSLSTTRKMHLIWVCKDASLLEFMLDYGALFDEEAYTFIFYTGNRELVFRRKLPHNLFLLKGRPHLETIITALVRDGETGAGLDLSAYLKVNDDMMDEEYKSSTIEHQFYTEMIRLLFTFTVEEIFNAASRRSRVTTRCICLEGLKELVDDLFVRKFSDDQLKVVFELMDTNNNGTIQFKEFQTFVKQMELDAEQDAKRQILALENVHNTITRELSGGSSQRRSMNIPEERAAKWRMMYCGGSAELVRVLQDISTRKEIPLSIESFDW